MLEDVRDSKRAPTLNTFVPSQLPRVRLIGRDEFDNFSSRRPCGEQFCLNRADPASDFKNSSTCERLRGCGRHYLAFEVVQTFLPIPAKSRACLPCLEHLFAHARTAAAGHERHNTCCQSRMG